jgi:hypothetical protein
MYFLYRSPKQTLSLSLGGCQHCQGGTSAAPISKYEPNLGSQQQRKRKQITDCGRFEKVRHRKNVMTASAAIRAADQQNPRHAECEAAQRAKKPNGCFTLEPRCLHLLQHVTRHVERELVLLVNSHPSVAHEIHSEPGTNEQRQHNIVRWHCAAATLTFFGPLRLAKKKARLCGFFRKRSAARVWAETEEHSAELDARTLMANKESDAVSPITIHQPCDGISQSRGATPNTRRFTSSLGTG